jgi:hypothetical protein
LPIETLNAHPVEFTLVSHSRIPYQDDDVAEKLKGSPSPGAGLSSFEQLPFWFIIKVVELTADAGCRVRFGKHDDKILRVRVDDAGVLIDVDTTADMLRLIDLNSSDA